MFYSERPSSNKCSIWSIYHYNKCSVSWKEKRTITRPLIYHLRFIILYAHSPNDNLPSRTTRYIAHSDITIVIGSPIIVQPKSKAQNITGDISLILLFPVVSIDSRAEKLELVESAAFILTVRVVRRAFYGLVNTYVPAYHERRENCR